MYMLLLIVIGLIVLFTAFMIRPKKRVQKKLVSLGIILVIAGGSGVYQSYQGNLSSGDNPKQVEKTTTADSDLANLNYQGTQEVEVNNNTPTFTKSELTVSNGPWQKFAD